MTKTNAMKFIEIFVSGYFQFTYNILNLTCEVSIII